MTLLLKMSAVIQHNYPEQCSQSVVSNQVNWFIGLRFHNKNWGKECEREVVKAHKIYDCNHKWAHGIVFMCDNFRATWKLLGIPGSRQMTFLVTVTTADSDWQWRPQINSLYALKLLSNTTPISGWTATVQWAYVLHVSWLKSKARATILPHYFLCQNAMCMTHIRAIRHQWLCKKRRIFWHTVQNAAAPNRKTVHNLCT